MILLKYDSSHNLLWKGTYDSTGLYNGAVAMVLTPDSNIAITGFSGTAFSSWDFETVLFGLGGAQISSARSVNASGSFSQPVSIIRDPTNSIIVVGTAASSGGNTDIKLVKYDNTLMQQWVQTYGDSTMNETASGAYNDGNGDLVVCGTAGNSSGGKNMVVASFRHHTGNLSWAQQISAPDPTKEASAIAITQDNNANAYVVGRMFNGRNFDIKLIGLDQNGNTNFSTSYSTPGTDNSATAVLLDNQNNIYVAGSSAAGADTTYIGVKYEQWSPTPCTDAKGSPPCADILYTFKNRQITTSGTDTFLEFDIYAQDSVDWVPYTGGTIYFTYSDSVFGANIVANGNIIVTSGTILADTTYSISVRDTLLKSGAVPLNCSELGLSIASSNVIYLYNMSDTLQQLCHIKMKMIRKGNYEIQFDKFFMQNQSFFNYTGSTSLPFINVYTGGPASGANDDVGITYRIDPFTIQLSTNRLTFHIQGQTNNVDGVTAAFQDGNIAVSFSTTAFDSNLVFNGAVTDSAIGHISDMDVMGNPLYVVSVSDDPANSGQFIVTISPSANYDPLQAQPITTGPGFDDMVSVTMIIGNCLNAGNIALNADTGNDYDNDVAGTENYSSVGIVPSPSVLTGVLCPPCTTPTITSLATSDDPSPSGSVSIPSGTQDKLLIINGCGFGTNIGSVNFQNADQDTDIYKYCFTNVADIQSWTENEISLYVPSTLGDPLNPNHGAATGPFFVLTADGDTIWSPSNITLTIPFAVLNQRNDYGVPVVFYLEQQSEIAQNCYGCCANSSNPADPCHTNGYLFTFLDPNDTIFNGYTFPSASFNDVKSSFKWAIEQWVCNTGVNFTVSDWLGASAELNQNDHNNMVLSIAPSGSAAVLPYSANADTHTNPGNACVTSVAIPNTSYLHTFYVAPIVDIDIVFNSTTTANPPAAGNPENYDYVLNDLSGIAGNQHPFSTVALHELGHSSGLDHVLPGTNEIMYYACGTGSGAIISALTSADIEGGSYVLDPIGHSYATTTNCTSDPNHANSSYCTYLGVKELIEDNTVIKVYPNPFEQSININLDLSDEKCVSLIIENTLGQEILNSKLGTLGAGSYNNSLQLPLKESDGIYFLKIILNNDTKIFKLIKI